MGLGIETETMLRAVEPVALHEARPANGPPDEKRILECMRLRGSPSNADLIPNPESP